MSSPSPLYIDQQSSGVTSKVVAAPFKPQGPPLSDKRKRMASNYAGLRAVSSVEGSKSPPKKRQNTLPTGIFSPVPKKRVEELTSGSKVAPPSGKCAPFTLLWIFSFSRHDSECLFSFSVDGGSKDVEVSASMPPPSQSSVVETEIITPPITTEGVMEVVLLPIPTGEPTIELPSSVPGQLKEKEVEESPVPPPVSSMGIEGDSSEGLQMVDPDPRGMANLAVNDGAPEGTVGSSTPMVGVSGTPLQAVSTMALSVVSEPVFPEGVRSRLSGSLPPRIQRLVEQVYSGLPLVFLFSI